MSDMAEQYEEIEDIELRNALDRGIDDMEAGRELPLDEAMAMVTELINKRNYARV